MEKNARFDLFCNVFAHLRHYRATDPPFLSLQADTIRDLLGLISCVTLKCVITFTIPFSYYRVFSSFWMQKVWPIVIKTQITEVFSNRISKLLVQIKAGHVWWSAIKRSWRSFDGLQARISILPFASAKMKRGHLTIYVQTAPILIEFQFEFVSLWGPNENFWPWAVVGPPSNMFCYFQIEAVYYNKNDNGSDFFAFLKRIELHNMSYLMGLQRL